jgi:hypothetical protein
MICCVRYIFMGNSLPAEVRALVHILDHLFARAQADWNQWMTVTLGYSLHGIGPLDDVRRGWASEWLVVEISQLA